MRSSSITYSCRMPLCCVPDWQEEVNIVFACSELLTMLCCVWVSKNWKAYCSILKLIIWNQHIGYSLPCEWCINPQNSQAWNTQKVLNIRATPYGISLYEKNRVYVCRFRYSKYCGHILVCSCKCVLIFILHSPQIS